MGAVELAGALADPEEVRRAVVPVVREAVAAGEGFLVAEQERLVGRVEVDLVQAALGREVDAAGRHEAQRPVDLCGEGLVAAALAAAGGELEVPGVHLGEVCEAPFGERPHEVQGGRRVVVGVEQAAGVRYPGTGIEGGVVHDVAPERGQLRVAPGLCGGGAGFGELAGDAAHLHCRDAGAVGEDDRHLQDDLELVADGVGRKRLEALGAVARLE